MWNNGNDCGCLWIILIIILLCCCGNGSSGFAGNSCTCHQHARSNFGCAGSNECCC